MIHQMYWHVDTAGVVVGIWVTVVEVVPLFLDDSASPDLVVAVICILYQILEHHCGQMIGVQNTRLETPMDNRVGFRC